MNGSLKYSKQREYILRYLSGTKEHPTADMVYENLRKDFPKISLGTVYRNLSLLVELGQIQKLSTPGQPDRYDYTTSLHYHFVCTSCGRMIDLPPIDLGDIDEIAGSRFDGIIKGHHCQFYGICAECK